MKQSTDVTQTYIEIDILSESFLFKTVFNLNTILDTLGLKYFFKNLLTLLSK